MTPKQLRDAANTPWEGRAVTVGDLMTWLQEKLAAGEIGPDATMRAVCGGAWSTVADLSLSTNFGQTVIVFDET